MMHRNFRRPWADKYVLFLFEELSLTLRCIVYCLVAFDRNAVILLRDIIDKIRKGSLILWDPVMFFIRTFDESRLICLFRDLTIRTRSSWCIHVPILMKTRRYIQSCWVYFLHFIRIRLVSNKLVIPAQGGQIFQKLNSVHFVGRPNMDTFLRRRKEV